MAGVYLFTKRVDVKVHNHDIHWIVLICVVVVSLSPVSAADKCECEFMKHGNSVPTEDVKQLEPLCGKRYSVDDDMPVEVGYHYAVGICTSADVAQGDTSDAVTQVRKNAKTGSKPTSLGSLKKAEIMTGTNWMYLEYEGGIKFGTHCASEERRAVIMISCKPGESEGKMRWLEENSNKSTDCYYLFELEHQAACSTAATDNSLSSGSIICIILTTIVGVYLILGALYMRLIRRAKGLNQIPNYSFWRDFGSLQADGCDLVCRCGGRSVESKQYHGIGDHQIECANDGEDQDDHLLPM